MKLTVFAATGRIGRQIVDRALAAGHDVTAVARNPVGLPAAADLVRVDLAAADPGAVKSAIRGADAVLSGLGPRTRADIGIAARGTHPIIEAATAEGVDRLIVVSAAPVATVAAAGHPRPPRHDPGDGPLARYLLMPLIRAAFRDAYVDLAEMEAELRESDLNWTAVRPPRLTDKPGRPDFRMAYGRNVRGGLTAARADVATAMLRLVDDERSYRQTVGIAS